jgi:hypothetical protein
MRVQVFSDSAAILRFIDTIYCSATRAAARVGKKVSMIYIMHDFIMIFCGENIVIYQICLLTDTCRHDV